MSGIKGVDIWVNFTEDVENNAVLAEIRSSKYNINEIAVKYEVEYKLAAMRR